jgi:hypothetical protein
VNYSLTNKLQLNFGISIFDQITPLNRYPEYRINLTMFQTYHDYSVEEPQNMNELYSKYNINTRGYPYSIYFIPELRIDYKIFQDTYLTFGARAKLWTGRHDYTFLIKVDGFLDNSNPQQETFHESRIKSQGIYTYIGLKYDIPIKN